jgi:hypothetical protein
MTSYLPTLSCCGEGYPILQTGPPRSVPFAGS